MAGIRLAVGDPGSVRTLKYCEQCGGLWTREVGNSEVRCPPCQVSLAEVPGIWSRRLKQAWPGRPGQSLSIGTLWYLAKGGRV